MSSISIGSLHKVYVSSCLPFLAMNLTIPSIADVIGKENRIAPAIEDLKGIKIYGPADNHLEFFIQTITVRSERIRHCYKRFKGYIYPGGIKIETTFGCCDNYVISCIGIRHCSRIIYSRVRKVIFRFPGVRGSNTSVCKQLSTLSGVDIINLVHGDGWIRIHIYLHLYGILAVKNVTYN